MSASVRMLVPFSLGECVFVNERARAFSSYLRSLIHTHTHTNNNNDKSDEDTQSSRYDNYVSICRYLVFTSLYLPHASVSVRWYAYPA